MPDHEDSLGGETLDGDTKADAAEQSLGDGATMGGDTAAHSLGDQSTFGDANVDDELFDDGMKLEDLSERYTEEGVLGKGGMGEVILATDTRLGRKVAIKRIIGEAARSKTAVQRFLTEAQSMAELSHPNIVQIYDYGRSSDGPFLIMECVQGGSLLDKCKAGPIELDEAVNIFGQLCDGLAKAHAAGIIHRDIKPANVLMTEDGIPKLTDFGLAKDDTADTGMTMEGAVIGTLDFMPPEQRQAAELTDHRSDLWSLAATFYQMLTGKSPMIIKFSDVPTQLHDALGKALEDDNEDRFQSALEMQEAVLRAATTELNASRDLGQGECPSCGTTNPSDRKFCRNADCAVSLEVDCLSCKTAMPMWEGVCGSCGTKQIPFLEEIRKTHQARHDEAENFLNEFKFDDALKAASAIGVQNDLRLQQFATWHEEFSTRVELSRTSEHARLEKLLREALAHERAYDYEAGLRTLSQVAPSLADTTLNGISDTAGQLSERLANNQSRLETLEGIIREKITKREISDLLPIVAELLSLRPNRPEVQKLKTRLDQRLVNQINTLLADGNSQYALGLLENLKTYGLTDEQITLYNRVKAMVETLPSPSIVPTVNKSQRKVQKDIWKRPTVIGISLLLVMSVLVLSISFMFGSSSSSTSNSFVGNQAASNAITGGASNAGGGGGIDVGMEGGMGGVGTPITNTLDMQFNLIPAGTFMMGSPKGETDRKDDEQQHKVTISKAFYMQTTEVTQGQWTEVMGTEPWTSPGKGNVKEGANYAATYVSWDDAVAYCKKLSEKEGKTYRLPTEAEWEYACRAGTETAWSFGDDEKELGDYAWYDNNADEIGERYAHPVEIKKPNAFGLYDMHGNVCEWCHDYYGEDYYKQSPEKDPKGPTPRHSASVLRGGSWNDYARRTRSALRVRFGAAYSSYDIGFRVVRELDDSTQSTPRTHWDRFNNNPKTYKRLTDVRGVVTFDGKPLGDATIVIYPDGGDGTAKPADGKTDAQGNFSLTTTFADGELLDGAFEGSYVLFVVKFEQMEPSVDQGGPPADDTEASSEMFAMMADGRMDTSSKSLINDIFGFAYPQDSSWANKCNVGVFDSPTKFTITLNSVGRGIVYDRAMPLTEIKDLDSYLSNEPTPKQATPIRERQSQINREKKQIPETKTGDRAAGQGNGVEHYSSPGLPGLSAGLREAFFAS